MALPSFSLAIAGLLQLQDLTLTSFLKQGLQLLDPLLGIEALQDHPLIDEDLA